MSLSKLSPTCLAEQRMGRIVRGSDCHSQCLDPLLRGGTKRFGGGRTVRPLWGRIVSRCKCLWGESLQCQMVRVGVSQCLHGRGGLIIKASICKNLGLFTFILVLCPAVLFSCNVGLPYVLNCLLSSHVGFISHGSVADIKST